MVQNNSQQIIGDETSGENALISNNAPSHLHDRLA